MEFQGVAFTQAQSDRLAAETSKIDALLSQRAFWDGQYNYYVSQVSNDMQRLDNCGKNDNNCKKQANDAWTYDASKRDEADSNRSNIINNLIPAANKQYNDVLASIQNEIKLAIQAAQANTANQTQLSQNQLTLTQNNPALLAQKAQAQAEIDKQKLENKHKTTVFVIVTITVVAIGFFVIKKLL